MAARDCVEVLRLTIERPKRAAQTLTAEVWADSRGAEGDDLDAVLAGLDLQGGRVAHSDPRVRVGFVLSSGSEDTIGWIELHSLHTSGEQLARIVRALIHDHRMVYR
jgi:hypothetical protein